MTKRVLVSGAAGMAGIAVARHFENRGYQVLRLSRVEYDIARQPFERFATLAAEADCIINCAGIIKPLVTPKLSVEEIFRVNALFPRNVATYCKSRDIPFIHITTDCAFSGRRGSYSEKDYFDADDIYGLSKTCGEAGSGMTLRTSIIGEERGQKRSLLEWARSKAGTQVTGYTNHLWNGVTTSYLAELMETIIGDGHYQDGVFHLHSPQPVTKCRLLEIISEVYGFDLKVVPGEGPEFCDRSLTSVYPLSKTVVRKTIEEQVRELKTFFESNF